MLRLIQTLIALLLGLPLYAAHPVESVPAPTLTPAKQGVEQVDKRTPNGKTWHHGGREYTYGGTIGDIHYKDNYGNSAEQWKDIDTSYYEDYPEFKLYNRMPFNVKIFKNRTGYEIEAKKDGSKYVIELDEIGGKKVTKHEDDDDLSFRFEISRAGVRLWKELKTNKAPRVFRWKVTEHKKGLLAFREDPEMIDRSTKEKAEKLKVTKTPIDAMSFYWQEETTVTGVDIDTDINETIPANADDGYCNGTTFRSTWDYCYIGDVSSASQNYFGRFTSVTIAKGVTITAARVDFYAYGSLSGTTVNLNVYMNAADDASAPTDCTTYGAKSTTSAVAWSSVGSWTANNTYSSPDISSAVQEVTDRAGWSSGNDMMVLVKNNSSSSGAYRTFDCISSLNTNNPAILYISYVVPSTFVPKIIIH